MNIQEAISGHSGFKTRICKIKRKGNRKDRGGTGREIMGVNLFKTHCRYEILKQ